MSPRKNAWYLWFAALIPAVLLVAYVGSVTSQERERERREGEPRREASQERDRPERERDARRPTEREVMAQQLEVLKKALPALKELEKNDAVELLERAIRAREVMLEGRRDDEAHQIRERAPNPNQLAEILKLAADAWREFGKAENAAVINRLAATLATPRDRDRESGDRRSPEAREREEGRRGSERERDAGRPATERDREPARRLSAPSERVDRDRPGARPEVRDRATAELHGTVRELRADVERLNRQVAEMQVLLRRLVQRLEQPDDDKKDDKKDENES